MKQGFILLCFLLFGVILFYSCQKELSCENCIEYNNPPIADAGPDQLIVLPIDSISLDGSSSSDADGTIKSYAWRKITGPASILISAPSLVKTAAKKLTAGLYQVELKVTDNGGLIATDTMQIIVNDPAQSNRPPVAIAGEDQQITLPVDFVSLDGSASNDPDNNISIFRWTKISGPSSFNIVNADSSITQVTTLVEGIYHFELKVTDAGGLFSKDTVQISIDSMVNVVDAVYPECLPLERPIINAQLVLVGSLSESRKHIAIVSFDNKIFFAGGMSPSGASSSTIDIYDIISNTWSKTKLSIPRYFIAAVTGGNKVFFAGGFISESSSNTSRVDIYDGVTNTWSTTELSEPRSGLSVAAVGNKILFAGGNKTAGPPDYTFTFTDKVDIYDWTTSTWTTAALSITRTELSATTVGDKVYFAGGYLFWEKVYDQIDIYDNSTGTWSISRLKEAKVEHGSIAVGNYIYWAGGSAIRNFNDHENTCQVEKRDLTTGASTIHHLFEPNANQAFIKNNSIVFYSGSNKFDIYNTISNLWSIGLSNKGFNYYTAISANNTIYIANEVDYGELTTTSQLWKLEF